MLDVLKFDMQTRSIPVVIVSDLAPTNTAKLKAAGAAGYFEKSRFLGGEEGETAFMELIDGVLRESEAAKPAGKASAPLARRQGA